MRPTTRDQVAAWVQLFTGFRLHATVRCSHPDAEAGTPHASQLDYVADGFLGVYSSAVVMAARNAGKSYAAAVLCLLDAWHKPKVKIAVAAFVRAQADYIYEYLTHFLAVFKGRIGKAHWKVTKDEIGFANGSVIRFFSGAKSQANVKGFHPDILIIDECDQWTAESFDGVANCLEASSEYRRFDCLSTNYRVSGDGVVLAQIKKYEQWNKGLLPGMKPCRTYRICLLDILERCPDTFKCFDESTGQHCPLWSYCRGKAKSGEGFYKVSAALETQRDSSRPTFESQMLLLRPSSEHSYFPTFGPNNVRSDLVYDPRHDTFLSVDLGGSRCPHAGIVVQRTAEGVYHVLHEWETYGNIEALLAKAKAVYPDATDFHCLIDPKGMGKADNYAGALSYANVFRREGFHPRARQSKRKESFDWLQRLIEPASGPTKFLVHKRCQGVVRQVQAAEHRVVKGHVLDEPADGLGDDLLDAVRFIVAHTYGRKSFGKASRNSITFF